MLNNNDKAALQRKSIVMALTEEGGVGPKMFQLLMMRLGPPENFLSATFADLENIPRFGEDKVDRLLSSLDKIDDYAVKISSFALDGVYVVTILDDEYPASLRALGDPPPILYFRGDWSAWEMEYIALVGTTRATQGGLRLTVDIAREFVRRGYGVVSGLAAGIDSAAHLGALKEQGTNIAVLGSGVSNIYPEENEQLANLIAANGLLISECPPDKTVTKSALILRNRLISAISRAVVVVQVGDTTQGELHTAGYASRQAKPLFYGDPDDDLNYEKVRKWPGAIIKTVESVGEIVNYMA